LSNDYGAYIFDNSDNNIFYHNNFINNTNQAYDECITLWNSTYPTGGNYWSNYSPTCPDLYDGAITPQILGFPDGICDIQYDIDSDSIDYYPLKYPWVGLAPPDITPPGTIIDLATSNPTINSITLAWTAPGDDGNSGSASGYIVKYSTLGPINDANWASAMSYGQSWTPLSSGNIETYIVTGLNQGTKYWFAIKAFDEVPNTGGISNSPDNTTMISIDTTPPDAIIDLATGTPTTDSITLTWTATGDNGSIGSATGYILKYSSVGQISNVTWNSATTYSQSWVPLVSGATETYVITGLTPDTTYWFAMKAYDEVSNYGNISNSPSEKTSEIPTHPPSSPTDLTAMPGDSFVELTWNAPTSDGGSPITNYVIYRGTSSGSLVLLNQIGNVLSYNDSDVTNGITYFYSVSALNAIGEGPKSDTEGIPATPIAPVNQPPVCTITYPTTGVTISGILVIEGTSSDIDGTVSKVEIKIDDGSWIEVEGTTSWSYDLNSSALSNGAHVIYIRSYDGENYSLEISINIDVNNIPSVNQKPTISITSPASGAKISGELNISGTALDNDGTVSKVEIKINEGDWIQVQGTTSWSYILDTTTLPNGQNTIKVRSYDGENFSEETSIEIKVDNPSEIKGKSLFEEPVFWLGIIIILVIIILLIILILKKRKPKEEITEEKSEEESKEVDKELPPPPPPPENTIENR
jgi:hypothetical protein